MTVKNFTIYKAGSRTRFTAEYIFNKQFNRRRDKIIFFFKKLTLRPKNIQEVFKQKERIWFSVPSASANIHTYYDAFFIIAVVLGLQLREEVFFNAPVTQEILEKAKEIEKYYRFEKPSRSISIHSDIFDGTQTPRTQKGQFFTLGVDSFYSLVSLLKKSEKNHFLLFVDGYDVKIKQQKLLTAIHKRIKIVGRATDTKPLFIQSNLRNLSDQIMNWGQFHGAALAAAGMMTNLKHVTINGESFDWPDWGLRFGLDTLFSTSSQKFVLQGHFVSREIKVQKILKSRWAQLFLDHVRVCWKNFNHHDPLYNCSNCQKCLRTKLTLQACNVLSTPTFKDVNLNSLSEVEIVGHVRHEWVALYEMLRKKNTTHPQLLVTLEAVLRKQMRV